MGQLTRFSKESINSLISKHGIRDYIETGTGEAISLQHASECEFKKLWSVDLDADWTSNANEKFKDERFHITNGYSTDFLSENLDRFDRALLFLDAHFPFADFHKISYEESIQKYKDTAFPLVDEIKILQKRSEFFRSSVIAVDDWVLYDESCLCEWVRMGNSFKYRDLAKSLGIDLSPSVVIDLLQETHNIQIFTEHQGYLLAIPK